MTCVSVSYGLRNNGDTRVMAHIYLAYAPEYGKRYFTSGARALQCGKYLSEFLETTVHVHLCTLPFVGPELVAANALNNEIAFTEITHVKTFLRPRNPGSKSLPNVLARHAPTEPAAS